MYYNKSYKSNRLERLPPELRYLIAEFIPSKPETPYPYIQLFKDIMLDWYNKSRVWDTNTVYHSYKEIYSYGIPPEDAPYFKKAFTRHRRESKYYNMSISNHTREFIKTARCRHYDSRFGRWTNINTLKNKIKTNTTYVLFFFFFFFLLL